MVRTHSKRCACGASSTFPLCDGSHQSAGWRCDRPLQQRVSIGFAASPSLVNLAERLAHRFNGVAFHRTDNDVAVDKLVILSDGQGMDQLRSAFSHWDSNEQLVIGVGLSNEALARPFAGAGFVSVPDTNATILWKATEAAVSGDVPQRTSSTSPKVFLSHAVVDEDRLYPIVDSMRTQFDTQVFVCSDSVPTGSLWRASITDHLERCDLFVLVASEASVSSVYCAFEIGMASALKKPIRIITLDGVAPPAFVSDIQATDVERMMTRKPWLDADDALLEAFLEASQAAKAIDNSKQK